MHGSYDTALMKRGAIARRLISEGEDAFRMFAAVVWPGRDWVEDALVARLVTCPICVDEIPSCEECGSTGLVTRDRHALLSAQAQVA
jgi:hypothetical protein